MPPRGGCRKGGRGRALGGDRALSQQAQGGSSSSHAPHVRPSMRNKARVWD
ncbi:hypothetical protein PIB30_033248 [Stylosanthes scabra]|uniref:Uncharacterized protein n=1 Tax=Stylosanthes scabra TaxID=79078 RepID=A0ABU6WC55_9FABA|nr:hypothetical protein [Stylosanthes scabra]